MPQSFHVPISIGTDICYIPRILRIITKYNGSRALPFVSKIFTQDEIKDNENRLRGLNLLGSEVRLHPINDADEYYEKRRALVHGDERSDTQEPTEHQLSTEDGDKVLSLREQEKQDRAIQGLATFLAGRFAAKEATIKAHRRRRLYFHDIVIKPGPLKNGNSTPPIALVRPEEPGAQWEKVMISISHDGSYAIASALAGEGREGQMLLQSWETPPGLTGGNRLEVNESVTDQPVETPVTSHFVEDTAAAKPVESLTDLAIDRESNDCILIVDHLQPVASIQDLTTVFQKFGPIRAASIVTGSGKRSTGHGLISFESRQIAERVINHKRIIDVCGSRVLVRTLEQETGKEQPGEAIMQALGHSIKPRAKYVLDDRLDKRLPVSAYSVHVSRLSKITKEADLVKEFCHLPSFLKATVTRNRGGVCLGYGFLAFGNVEDAYIAMGMHKKVKVNKAMIKIGRKRVDSKMVMAVRSDGSFSYISQTHADRDISKDPNDSAASVSRADNGIYLKYQPGTEERKKDQGAEIEFWIQSLEVFRAH